MSDKPVYVDKPNYQELSGRISRHLAVAKSEGHKREIIICWCGYIASLLEWGQLADDDYVKLWDLLPGLEDNPVSWVFLDGDPDDDDEE